MFLTRVLLFYVRRRRIPGKIDIGKHQLVKPVTASMKAKALASLLQEKYNLSLIGRSFLTEEEEASYDDSAQREEEFARLKDEKILQKMFKNYTMEEHLGHLNISKKWE